MRAFLGKNDTANTLLGAGERDQERKYMQGKFNKSRESAQIFSDGKRALCDSSEH